MTFFTIALLLGLGVLVSGFPRPTGHGAGTFRHTSGGQGLYGFRNSGNLDFGHWGIPNNGGSSTLVSSLGNINGRGISTGNRANINYGPGIFRDQFGGEGYSNIANLDFGHTGIHSDSLNNGGNFVSERSVGNLIRNGISSGNRANIYDGSGSIGNNFGNWDFGHTGRHSHSLNNGGSFVSDRSVDIISGRGISSGNRANIYDVYGNAVNGHPGKVSGDIFRNFGRDGVEFGGFHSFE